MKMLNQIRRRMYSYFEKQHYFSQTIDVPVVPRDHQPLYVTAKRWIEHVWL